VKHSVWLAISVLGFASTTVLSGCGGGANAPPPVILVTISPDIVQPVDEGQTINFSATVINDKANMGVTWRVTCPASSCGSLSGQTGTSAVYSAPTPVKTAISVTVIATSAADSTKSASEVVAVAAPPSITTTSLPDATGGVAYSAALQESGGVAPFTWTWSGDSFPPGLNFGGDGTISGTPTTGGKTTFTVQVADSGNPPLTASANLSLTVTILPLSVTTTSLPTATVDAAYSQSVQATGGIPPYTWSISSGSLPSWATLRSAGVISGIPGVPGTASFTVQVADSESTVLTSTQPLSLDATMASSANDAELKGHYAFLFNGFDDVTGSQIVVAGSFVADGTGKITAGIEDQNGPGGPALSVPFTGTYDIDSDNRGGLTLTNASGSTTYALVLNSIVGGVAQNVRIIEFDDTTGTSGQRGSGEMRLQDTSSFSLGKVNGAYAFGFSGQDATGNREAMAGSFSADGTGTISSGVADQNIAGTTTNPFLSGSYTAPSPANGRLTLSLIPSGASGLALSAYVVSSSEFLVMTTNSFASDGLVSGTILAQKQASFDNTALDAPAVYYELGVNPSAAATQAFAEIGLLSPDGNGGVSVTYDNQRASSIAKNGAFSATYSVGDGGRVTVTGWYGLSTGPSVILYLVDKNKAFFLDISSAAGFGFAEPQLSASGGFSNSSFSGNFSAATIAPSTALTLNGTATATLDGSGAFSEAASVSNTSGLFVSQTTSGTYSIDTNGRGTVTKLSITNAMISTPLWAFAAAAILLGRRRPRRRRSRPGFALFCFAALMAVTPAGCPPIILTNQLVFYVISTQKAVMIHQQTGNTSPEITIIEQ
jgi:Putative Ig domain